MRFVIPGEDPLVGILFLGMGLYFTTGLSAELSAKIQRTEPSAAYNPLLAMAGGTLLLTSVFVTLLLVMT
jgi:hypothetical protein